MRISNDSFSIKLKKCLKKTEFYNIINTRSNDMKKIKIFLVLLLSLILPNHVLAANNIHNIAIDVNLLQNGTAEFTETWSVDGSDGTEWYKVINDLDNMELTDFTVSMDGNPLTYKTWNINESLQEKAGYYGINYTNNGLELCFGKSDYQAHTFTLKYKISNFIFNTDDAQVIYFNFIDKLSEVNFENFQLTIRSYYSFPDTLDVWGYGYKGYAYVENGLIKMSNEENTNMNDNYVVLLAKFPLNTFTSTNSYSSFNTFNDVYDMAEEDTFDYDYGDNSSSSSFSIISLIVNIIQFFFLPLILIIFFAKLVSDSKYGYIGNKKITKENTPMFRHIPCNKDIYYANALINLNNFGYKETNIMGAIILKWVRQDKIKFNNITKGIFNKETSVIDLTLSPSFDNEIETELFNIMYQASKDGILETKELEKWCRNNYNEFLNLFKKITNNKISELKSLGYIYQRQSKEECKYKNVMNDQIYKDSQELYGLKLFLEEFSQINTKEVMEVKLWDEYLMFAYLFGIADQVAKQLKDLYPEVLEEANLDYDTFIFVSNISTRSVSAASSARQAAESYSSGGGGFSSGGGGGGSFGGGGGGSR